MHGLVSQFSAFITDAPARGPICFGFIQHLKTNDLARINYQRGSLDGQRLTVLDASLNGVQLSVE